MVRNDTTESCNIGDDEHFQLGSRVESMLRKFRGIISVLHCNASSTGWGTSNAMRSFEIM